MKKNISKEDKERQEFNAVLKSYGQTLGEFIETSDEFNPEVYKHFESTLKDQEESESKKNSSHVQKLKESKKKGGSCQIL